MVRILCEFGADINTRDVNGRTVLHSVIHGNYQLELFQLLCENGANVSAKCTYAGETPLHYAAYYGNLLQLLLLNKKKYLLTTLNIDLMNKIQAKLMQRESSLNAVLISMPGRVVDGGRSISQPRWVLI